MKVSIWIVLTTTMFFSLIAKADDGRLSGSIGVGNNYLGANTQLICNKVVAQGHVAYAITDRFRVNVWGSTDLHREKSSSCKEIDYSVMFDVTPTTTLQASIFDLADLGDPNNRITEYKISHAFNQDISVYARTLLAAGADDGYDLNISYHPFGLMFFGLNVGKTPGIAQETYVTPSIGYFLRYKSYNAQIKYSHSVHGPEETEDNFNFSIRKVF